MAANQRLVISAKPIANLGLQALQKTIPHNYFRNFRQSPEIMQVFPTALSTGFIELSIEPNDSSGTKIELPVEFYAIEGIDDPSIDMLVLDTKPFTIHHNKSNQVLLLEPPQHINRIRVIPQVDKQIKLIAHFIVPDRLRNAFRTGKDSVHVNGDNLDNVTVYFEKREPENFPGYGAFMERGFAVEHIDLLAPISTKLTQSATYKIIKNQWDTYDVFNPDPTLANRVPDFLYHPYPRFTVKVDDVVQTMIFKVTLHRPIKELRLGSMGFVTSFENSIRIYLSNDGHNFHYAYSHKPQMLSNYQEIVFQPIDLTFYIRIDGFRRSELFLNERNFVSLSHLFLFVER